MAFKIVCGCAASAVLVSGFAVTSVGASFPLEWNSTYPTDVPYEVELHPDRLGAKAFTVKADGHPLETRHFVGRVPGTIDLRFAVPKGTKVLTCETSESVQDVDSSTIDNLFSGALDAENIGKWKLPKGVTAVVEKGGIRFEADATAPANAYVDYEADVPVELAGQPAKLEADLTSHAKLAWGGAFYVQQLDANGKILPEALTDVRWTTHMRPSERLAAYREEGRFHPQAKKLRVHIELRRLGAKFDDYGFAVTNSATLLPSLSVSRLAVRSAATLPFPKYDDSFFGRGPSDAIDDFSFKMGGANGKAFFYQTHTRACWSQAYQFRREEDLAYPSGAGTVEAWFKPDWQELTAIQKSRGIEVTHPVTLFDAFQGYRAAEGKKADVPMMRLKYAPVEHRFSLVMHDYTGREYKSDWKGKVDLPEGKWTHIALQWEPKGVAELYVNGKPTFSLAIPEWQATPIGDASIKEVNDLAAMEFFFGCCSESARLTRGDPPSGANPFFEGEADGLRVSTGRRYVGAFVPEKRPTFDASTRVLFTFDRTFDGRCGGYGFVPGCVRAMTDRVSHELMVERDGKQMMVQYFPKEVLPEHDPAKVLDTLNYPVVSSDADHRASRIFRRKSFTIKNGDRVKVSCPEGSQADFVEITNVDGKEPLLYPILVNKGRLDPRSFGDLSDALRQLKLSDREMANTVFQYVISASDYFMNHQACFAAGSDVPHSACYEAMIMLNSYCGFECGPLNNMTANMLTTVAQLPAAQTGGYGHSFQEVFFDGKNHIYDLSWQRFFPAMDNESSANLKELGDQPGIHNRMNMSPDHFMRKGTRGFNAQNPSYQEKCALVLNPGETFRLMYANNGQMNNLQTWPKGGRWGKTKVPQGAFDYAKEAGADDKGTWTLRMDRIFPHYSTGIILFDGRPSVKNPAFGDVTENSFTYRVRSCYPIVWGEYAAYLNGGKTAALDISTDGGKTWSPLPKGAKGTSALEYRTKARHDYLVRIKAPIVKVTRFTARTEGEVNPRTYPGFLRAGENELLFKANSVASAKVTLGWREKGEDIVFEGASCSGTLPGFERALVLVNPSEPQMVTVKGVSKAAKVCTHGRVSATLKGGQLTLKYDQSKPRAFKHGDDLPIKPKEFPAFAAVDVIDGARVRTLTVIVSPNARLVTAKNSEVGGAASFAEAGADAVQDRVLLKNEGDTARFNFAKIPAGRYVVFALGRTPSHCRSNQGRVELVDPKDAKKSWQIFCDSHNAVDYLDVDYAHTGERSRWKWGCSTYDREWGQAPWSSWSIRTWQFPETDHLDFKGIVRQKDAVIELAAALVLPDPDDEFLCEATKVLCGMNCEPFRE